MMKSICIPASVQVLCTGRFANCFSLSSLTFESDSKLSRIGGWAFSFCGELRSIRIPGSIRLLEKDWRAASSLGRVIFESGASFLAMIQAGKVDLHGYFDIYIVHWDEIVSFPGFSVVIIPSVDNSVRLVTSGWKQ
jgi:hypothetical protein